MCLQPWSGPSTTPTATPTATPTMVPVSSPATCASFECGRGQFDVANAANVQCANGECTANKCCTDSFVVVRPFFAGDADDLVESFERWDAFTPCELNADGTPKAKGLPVDIVLYFARDITASENQDVLAKMQKIQDVSPDDADWRKCFRTITVLGGNLTAYEDQYHTRRGEASWNRGPNVQFYMA